MTFEKIDKTPEKHSNLGNRQATHMDQNVVYMSNPISGLVHRIDSNTKLKDLRSVYPTCAIRDSNNITYFNDDFQLKNGEKYRLVPGNLFRTYFGDISLGTEENIIIQRRKQMWESGNEGIFSWFSYPRSNFSVVYLHHNS